MYGKWFFPKGNFSWPSNCLTIISHNGPFCTFTSTCVMLRPQQQSEAGVYVKLRVAITISLSTSHVWDCGCPYVSKQCRLTGRSVKSKSASSAGYRSQSTTFSLTTNMASVYPQDDTVVVSVSAEHRTFSHFILILSKRRWNLMNISVSMVMCEGIKRPGCHGVWSVYWVKSSLNTLSTHSALSWDITGRLTLSHSYTPTHTHKHTVMKQNEHTRACQSPERNTNAIIDYKMYQ